MTRPRGPLYVYDGRDLFAVVEHRVDGWHATIKGNRIGPFISAELAFALINAKRSKVAAAPIEGERGADIKHVSQIQKRQRQAQQRAAEKCRAPMRGVIQAGKHRRLVDNKPEGTGSRATRSRRFVLARP
jgi:hypothetical protein